MGEVRALPDLLGGSTMFLLFKTVIIDDLTLKENCVLSAIYHLNRSKKRVLTGLLSESLHIPARTMARIISSLIKKNYLTVNKYYDTVDEITIRYYYASKKTLAIYQDASGTSRPIQRRAKREVPLPSWYSEYKKNLSEQDKQAADDMLPKDIAAIAKDIFGE